MFANMDIMTNEDILDRFPYCLRENLRQLWTSGKIGISSMQLQINMFPRKLSRDWKLHTGNNFMLEIPYAGRRLHWEVFFNDEDNTFAPDFDFVNDQFLCDPDLETILENVPSLAKWDVKNPKSFITIVKELMGYYKICQIRKLEIEPKFSSLHREYLLLKKELNILEEDLEVYVDNASVQFLIALKLNFSSLPVYIQKSYFKDGHELLNPGDDTATLQISFCGNRTTSYLQFSPRLENALGDCKLLHIPPYKRDINIVEYVHLAHKLLDEKVEQIKHHYEMKQTYISALLSLAGCSVIEYDNIDFSKALFLFEVDGFHCLVHFVITNRFPQEKPQIVLRSVYHRMHGKLLSLEIHDYPYSPRWLPEEMVKRVLKKISEDIPKFKTQCASKN